MNNRQLKDLLYEQVARIGKALASPKRLELLEMLAQGEKSVDALAAELSIDIKLASAHLKALRDARLVTSRREGKFIHYRLTGADVAGLGVKLREVAEEHLLELRLALQQMMAEPDRLASVGRKELLAQAKRGEFAAVHTPEMIARRKAGRPVGSVQAVTKKPVQVNKAQVKRTAAPVVKAAAQPAARAAAAHAASSAGWGVESPTPAAGSGSGVSSTPAPLIGRCRRPARG